MQIFVPRFPICKLETMPAAYLTGMLWKDVFMKLSKML